MPITLAHDAHSDPADPRGAPTQPGTGTALSCHALLLRLPAGTVAADLRAAAQAAAASRARLRSLRLWVEPVSTPAADPAAEARRDRELRRPARLRAVVLAFSDGVCELIIVADRGLLGRAGLAELAALLTDPAHDADLSEEIVASQAPAPSTAPRLEWGLGDPHRAGHTAVIELSPTAAPVTEGSLALVVAATATALARYDSVAAPRVGVFADGAVLDEVTVAIVEGEAPRAAGGRGGRAGESATIGELLVAAAGATSAERPVEHETAAVTVALNRREPGYRYEPCIEAMHGLTLCWAQAPDGRLHGTCWVDEGVVDPVIAARFGRQVVHLVDQIARAAPDAPASQLELLDARESAEILALGRPAVPAREAPETVDEAFRVVARQQPDAPAVSDAGRTLTYRELDADGDAVAAGLAAVGVRAGDRVGVCLERDVDLLATLLGILRAGAAYVPMDPAYPEQRLRYVIDDARLGVVVTTHDTVPGDCGARLVRPSELRAGGAGRYPTPAHSAEDPAYVIYTSGSTGRPKGVVVRHRNVAALLVATARTMALGPDDVWTLFHSSAFDFSVWEMWGCLLTGGHLVAVEYWLARSPEQFYDLLAARSVTVLSQTPSAFAQLVEVDRTREDELSLRLVVFGGEPLDVAMLRGWMQRHPTTHCRLVNMFGITETTVHVTAQDVTAAEVAAGSRSVGRALGGWSVSVRDERGRVCPLGAAGEIYVGGEGVASHYLNRDDLTSKRFISDPLTGERIYRSGDCGRLRPDGRLDHLGRLDGQVKLRGHRIELGEIRAVLLEQHGVRGAAVVLGGGDRGDAAYARLDAYVVLRGATSPAELRRSVARTLPEYMVPATITVVAELPLNVNGKVDVARLPAPARAAERHLLVPPVAALPDAGGDLAATVLRAWRDVLGVGVAADDDFFAIGGNSLLAVRLTIALREAGLPRVALRELYLHPTASRLTAFLDGPRRETAAG